MSIKIFLMAVPCSGKTWFHARFSSFQGLRVVDFSRVNRRSARGVAEYQEIAAGNSYSERLGSFFRSQEGQICVIGRMSPRFVRSCDDVLVGSVIPNIEDHERNCELRKVEHPGNRFGEFSQVLYYREKLEAYSIRKNIRIYSGFSEAIQDICSKIPA